MSLLLLTATQASAQFPVGITIQWDANPATDDVTGYNLVVSQSIALGNPVVIHNSGSITPSSACVNNVCSYKFSVPAAASYTITGTATNFWGTSDPATFKFSAVRPGNSMNIRIRIP